ncbi:hypothetical protein Tco_0864234 [Tanacetum coccineum]
MFVPTGSSLPTLQTAKDLQGDELLHYDAEIELMNLILLSIPNEIYNSVDACTTAKEMWKRVELDSFDDLFDYLQQFEKLVNASRAKKLEKSHDPLALVAHMESSSRNTLSYYELVQARVRDSKYFMEQMLLAKQDEAGVILTDEQNDFLFADASRMEEIEELSANICLMARIQPADNTSDAGPSYDSAFISEEAEKQQLFAQKVQQQNTTLSSQLELYKERVRVLENIKGDNNYLNEFLEADRQAKHFNQQAQSQFVRDRDIIRDLEKQRDKLDLAVTDYKRKNEELQKTHLILKRQMSENEDRYHDTILDLESKLKKNVDLILKLGNSLQGMFMLGPKPLYVHDSQLKHGLGYPNPYTLKQAISQCPKLYIASSLSNSEIPLNVRDTEDTLDDASKSQQKVKEKMNDPIAFANKQNCWTIDYKQINALYKDFVPLKELSAEQKYFLSSFIPSDKTPNATSSIPASIPNQFKPIVNELQFYFEFFRKLFQMDIKEMKDVFKSTESELYEIKKQNDFLKDKLLEASLKHEVEISVLLNHECVDNFLHVEIEQIKKNSIEIQEGLQAKIKILEKDVQRCQKQSVDFELKLQHEKEKHKWESNLNNKNTNPLDYYWISKMEKLKNENVSLEFQVQSLIKERDNVKLEYHKLFDSIKMTRTQSKKEMDELIDHVSEKTYAYGAIRAENPNLLSTISELKTRLATVEKGKSVNTKFDKTNVSQNLLCVTPINKQVFQTKTVVSKTKEKHVVSKPVTLQTSPDKQRGANSNNNVIAPGMYRVVTTQESQTNEAKSDLSSTGMNVASSVRRLMNRDLHVKNSVLAKSNNSAKKVVVYVRKNKQTDNTSANVISNKENVNDVNVANAAKAKTLLCVSCMQNVLIPCHDKCFAKYKLNVHLNDRRGLSSNSRTPTSSDTTYVVLKTRFSEKLTQSKSLDTTSIVSKPKIDV